MDASKRIEDLLFIASKLADLLEEENAALQNNRFDVVQKLLESKTALSRAYEIRVFGMKNEEDRSLYDDDDLIAIEQLRSVGNRVAELIVENERMLRIGLEVSRRFMECVADSVKQVKPGTGAYTSNGIIGATGSASKQQAPSLALDEVL
ncbi:hypothetical protein [Magnetovibrio blakemorei]|uniref:Flagellar protein FlgN n=1 Tax=Magnetovibrio blakemorei TaxID=28181 RepID=A0A1E5QAB7_9PROT|nr:hypothetical protein [Magnetovibrio blakemorei]OEJ68729.1 hypothetical protein BEN30_05855 [Magnetovibrio blakemorei]